MSTPTLIFDFDGTIADTHHYVVGIANRLAPEFGYDQMPWDEVEALRDKTAKEMIHRLKVPMLKIPAIMAKAKRVFHEGIDDIELIEGLHDVLHELHARGCTLGILSSNATRNIERFLSNRDIKVFDFIHGTTKIWSKNHSLERLIKQRGISRERLFYVGDETRDIDAGKRIKATSVAVNWGFNSEATLRAHNPDVMITAPRQLLDLI